MVISFPGIVYQWIALISLASSERNEMLSDQRVESIAKPVAGVNPIFKEPAPVLLRSHQWFGVDAVELGRDIEI